MGLFYDLLRPLRLAAPWRALQGALDLLFWLGACAALFGCGILLGAGRVRLYMAGCLALGAAAYFALASPWVRRVVEGAARWMGRALRILLAPFLGLGRVLAAPFVKIFRRIQKSPKKGFPFSRPWSKIYCLILRGSPLRRRPRQGKEAAAHVPLQKDRPCGKDRPGDPAGVSGAHPGERPAADLRRPRRHRHPHPAGGRTDPGQHGTVQRH
ncbi:MAG TPA: spore cortex biosynthesis protein YabQ [Candidatus Evtepia faecavium]|nr:spore cortex biosynthesis protein YabQ [Candidatus Evtepia faecavium]